MGRSECTRELYGRYLRSLFAATAKNRHLGYYPGSQSRCHGTSPANICDDDNSVTLVNEEAADGYIAIHYADNHFEFLADSDEAELRDHRGFASKEHVLRAGGKAKSSVASVPNLSDFASPTPRSKMLHTKTSSVKLTQFAKSKSTKASSVKSVPRPCAQPAETLKTQPAWARELRTIGLSTGFVMCATEKLQVRTDANLPASDGHIFISNTLESLANTQCCVP